MSLRAAAERPRPRIGRQVVITVVMTAVILAVGETGLRAWAYFFRHSYQRYDARLGMMRLVPGYDVTTVNGRIVVNPKGFRGPDFEARKPPGVYRIFNVGDSVTFGLAGEDCPYSRKLERLLNRRGDGRRYEVVNAGVEGYNSRDALRLLEHEILTYQPDLITVLIGWNDLMKHDPGGPAVSKAQARAAYAMYDVYLVRFWRKVVYSYVRPLVQSVRTDRAEADTEAYRGYVPIVFEEQVTRMIRLAREGGADVVLMTRPSALHPGMTREEIARLHFPHYTYSLPQLVSVHRAYNDAVRRLGAREGVAVVDAEAAFVGKEPLFFDTMHPYCEGNDVFAGILAGFLAQRGGGRAQARPAREHKS
jgi:lysophospholipase L1-like esterase